jgi:hypothetical protein
MYFPWSLDDDTIAFENTFDNLDSLKKYKVSLEETLERIDVPGAERSPQVPLHLILKPWGGGARPSRR